ncbi:Os11g0118875 [Oryza sativa Japonica Group]|uniref:Os11g0118875 protein n=1 Tax=Oryza sativa subsp. japonica TaxID=39947 RepID=A0A0N7KSC5_ORYSJ|nr:hypothetical protein EE612_053196 [Oryza sativa]BAT12434.1 Os11g0118875 [Oryza sativa Japonica Group]
MWIKNGQKQYAQQSQSNQFQTQRGQQITCVNLCQVPMHLAETLLGKLAALLLELLDLGDDDSHELRIGDSGLEGTGDSSSRSK